MYRKSVVFFTLVLVFWKDCLCQGVNRTKFTNFERNRCALDDLKIGKCVSSSDCDDDLVTKRELSVKQAATLTARVSACSSTTRGIKMVCCMNVINRRRYSEFVPKDCGTPRNNTNSTFGWTVLIGTGHFYRRCVGTLINNGYVLTSADCIHGVQPNKTTLFFGDVLVDTLPRCSNKQSCRNVTALEFLSHENYDPFTKKFNVALIKTAGKQSFGNQAYPICLPLNTTEEDTDQAKRHILRPRINIKRYGIQEACGYSGAPIVVMDNEMRYHIVGVANHPVDCDRKRVKRDATPIMEYVDWILSVLPKGKEEPTDSKTKKQKP